MTSRKFGANNKIRNSRSLFNQRAKYRNDAIPEGLIKKYPGVFRNFWFIENMYYGKIDRLHRFLIPRQEKIKPVQLDGGDTIFLFDFAAEAVVDLLKEHKKGLSSGKISKEDDTLSVLRPKNGYTNPLLGYELLIKQLFDNIYPKIVLREAEINDFNDFIDTFLDLFYEQKEKLPISLTGFVSSRHSPLTMTGIFLEVTDLTYDNDQNKIDNIIDNRNFLFFIKNSIKHGFLIDSNAPARICANLGSVEMERYLRKYNSSSESVFEDYYSLSYIRDIDYIFQYLINLYNKFISFRPFIRKEIIDSRYGHDPYRFVQRRIQMTKKSFDLKYNNEYKLNLYIDIRNHECDYRYEQALIMSIKQNAKSFLNTGTFEDALTYVNHQFIGFLNDSGAYNALTITSEALKDNPKNTGQDVSDLLDRSVARSRGTIY